jgi:DNA-binding NtrC family response regulator
MKGRILVVEDDPSLRQVIQAQLVRDGFETVVAPDGLRALEILGHADQDLVLCDLSLPGMSGLEVLKKVRLEYPETTTIIMTAYGSVDTAVDAMKLGAYDYLTKPIHPYALRVLVKRVFEHCRLTDEVQLLRGSIDRKSGFENIIGHSPALLQMIDATARVARTDATVLIRGETGTGKELLAKAVHFNSPRREGPFVVINCGAIPRELLESELFGHVKGAFTGAFTHKKGKVESADGGTVFLDEIGEMPLDLQVRVLRLIEEREIEKVGLATPIKVNVRIVAATHRDLEAFVERGAFRPDLYYRLAVVPITLPPLRDRLDDIPELVAEFFAQTTKRHHRETLRLPQSLIPYFAQYDWPGNVRQLLNCIERMVVLCPGDEITLQDLPEFLRNPAAKTPEGELRFPAGMTLQELERELIARTLRKVNGNQTKTAADLGISRKTLLGRIVKYQIKREDYKAASAKIEAAAS